MRLSAEDEAVLARAADMVFSKVDTDSGILHLSRPHQVFIVVHSAQGVIDNGGFQYLFESDWPASPPYSFFADAYRAIGVDDVAGWLEEAVALFPFSDPHLKREERVNYLRYCVEADSPMGLLSDRAIDASDRVFQRLALYVRSHESEFAEG